MCVCVWELTSPTMCFSGPCSSSGRCCKLLLGISQREQSCGWNLCKKFPFKICPNCETDNIKQARFMERTQNEALMSVLIFLSGSREVNTKYVHMLMETPEQCWISSTLLMCESRKLLFLLCDCYYLVFPGTILRLSFNGFFELNQV